MSTETVTRKARAPTSYIYFCNEKRAEVKESFPDLKFVDVGRKLGEMWNNLSAEEKQPYIKLYNARKEEIEISGETVEVKVKAKKTKESGETKKKETKESGEKKKKPTKADLEERVTELESEIERLNGLLNETPKKKTVPRKTTKKEQVVESESV